MLLYRGTRVVNFAHAGFGAIGAYVFWNLYPDHVPMLVALVAAIAAGAAAGIATERLVARPLAAAPILTLAVATLAVDEIIRFWLTKLAARHRHRPLQEDGRLVTDDLLRSWDT